MPQDLPDEERITGRFLPHGIGKGTPGVVDRVAGRRREELDHPVLVEAPDAEPRHVLVTAQVGQRGRQRMTTIQVGVTIRTHHEQTGDRFPIEQ